jgi:hypothetical protein
MGNTIGEPKVQIIEPFKRRSEKACRVGNKFLVPYAGILSKLINLSFT